MAKAINIKYSNKTSHTDFEVMVFTKNYSTRSPKTYYVAWQVLRGQTAVYFKYPLDTLEVGATYQESGLRIVSGPFHADVGSSWRITQPKPTDTALLLPSKLKFKVTHPKLKSKYCVLNSNWYCWKP